MLAGSKFTYSRRCLQSLRSAVQAELGDDVAARVHQLGVRRHRGRRAGRAVRARLRTRPVLRPTGNGAYTVFTTERRPSPWRRCVYGSDPRHLTLIAVQRHTTSVGRSIVCGSMNVRSLSPLKLDALLDEFRERKLDVMLLCETWHDADSVAIRSLRSQGFRVVERARPRSRQAEASVRINHGGVAIVVAPGIHLTTVDVGFQPTTFEHVAARITSGTSSCVAVEIYRPGSAAVTSTFFDELAELLDRLSVSTNELVLAGDVNIRLEREADPDAAEFHDLIAGYGLTQHVSGATYDAGGTLDVVCTQHDLPTPTVNVVDIGLSDHRLLLWTTSLSRPPPVYVKSVRRAWRSFDLDQFHTDLQMSPLCDERAWQGLDGDSLVQLYDDTITQLLDQQIPANTKTCRRRPSNAWFDDDCRRAKQLVRSKECAARHAGPLSDRSSPTVQAWPTAGLRQDSSSSLAIVRP